MLLYFLKINNNRPTTTVYGTCCYCYTLLSSLLLIEGVSPLLRPTSAGADSSSTEGYTIDSYPLSPSLSIGELDNEEKRKEAAEHREYVH